jgi:hypothetical protein
MFQQHDGWFDLLCILDLPNKKGTAQSAEERRAEEAAQKGKPYTPPTRSADESSHEAADSKFIQSILSGIEAKLGEEWVRSQFFYYTDSILSDAHEISRRSSSFAHANNSDSADSTPSTPTPLHSHHPASDSSLVTISSPYSSPAPSALTFSATPTSSSAPPRGLERGISTRGGGGLGGGGGGALQLILPLTAYGANGAPVHLPINLIEKVKKRIEANRSRLRLLLSSTEYKALPASPWVWSEFESSQFPLLDQTVLTRTAVAPSSAEGTRESGSREEGAGNEMMTVSGELLASQIRRLQSEMNLDELEIEAIFSLLVRGLTTESSMQTLLTLLPHSEYGGPGGLHVIAVGLLHSNSRIRTYAVKLLTRLSSYASTVSAYESMNQYYKCAMERNTSLLDNPKTTTGTSTARTGGTGITVNGNGRGGSITR